MTEIRQLIASSAFSDLDRHFAAFIEAQAGGEQPLVALAAALVSCKRSEGHICLDLEAIAGSTFPDLPPDGVNPIHLPRLKDWTKALNPSPVVGSPGDFKPLILDARHRLYLHRYWEYEQSLAAAILKRAADLPPQPDSPTLTQKLHALFPPEPGETINWQCVAALAAVRRKFCVISGGPGTGKTHTLVLILALLLELERNRKLRIAVAAPTGKAAARIQDSIRTVKATLACDEATRAQLPERATTIHRLLGYLPDSARFRHNADNPLPFDVVAVDEASMVDLALMAKLFQAIPPSARVILLGDKDQLASVEAGAVLGDICSAAASDASPLSPSQGERAGVRGPLLPLGSGAQGRAALADCVVQLKKNYRFGQHSAIYRLSNAINEGRAENVLQILRDCGANAADDLISAPLPRRAELKEALRARVTAGFTEFLKASDPLAALAALARFRILCALREGPFGVAGLNQATEEILEEAGLIRPQNLWYARRPIMITRNDYNLKLFNGDIGLLLPDADTGEPRAFFPGPDNTLRKFLPLRLPEHETAYALTVHKSQGSEFDRVLLILPDRESPVLSRELLYTGITRARTSVELWFDEQVFRAALARRVTRTSGLCDALQ
ncbi:MAG: exodeoxyribonuclease V subunit alpha [Verrucomicrobiota bacterium]|jgi:exodeoxyribonuclease V alpha subunit